MTDQQKKAVEKAAQAFVKEHASTIPFGQDSAVKADFRSGAEEVISNPEKYGLVPFEYYKQEVKERKEAHEDHRAERKENARLRSALLTIANWTYGLYREHGNQALFAEKALKGGEL